jgi:hypothetical protein
MFRRFAANRDFTSKWMNFMRAVSSDGHGRLKFYRQVRKNLIEDQNFRDYFEGETTELPPFYTNIIKKGLGIWWEWLPKGAVEHDSNAYLHKSSVKYQLDIFISTYQKKLLFCQRLTRLQKHLVPSHLF